MVRAMDLPVLERSVMNHPAGAGDAMRFDLLRTVGSARVLVLAIDDLTGNRPQKAHVISY